MIYQNILPAKFISRPNRFIAHILLEGKEQICHVKNTGRCKELLIPGCNIFVQKSNSPKRKTEYDLISVEKGGRLINMDSAAPNQVFAEYAASGGLGFRPDILLRERQFADSRFDFYLEHKGKKFFAEIKGVTLEDNGIVRFPDAPTTRGLKHLKGLINCVQQGYGAYAVFIIQMKNVKYFEANRETHPEFAEALKDAAASGVQLLAIDCEITSDSIAAADPVEIKL